MTDRNLVWISKNYRNRRLSIWVGRDVWSYKKRGGGMILFFQPPSCALLSNYALEMLFILDSAWFYISREVCSIFRNLSIQNYNIKTQLLKWVSNLDYSFSKYISYFNIWNLSIKILMLVWLLYFSSNCS